jgi:hypothetical protein
VLGGGANDVSGVPEALLSDSHVQHRHVVRVVLVVLLAGVGLFATALAALAATQPNCNVAGNLVGDRGFEQPAIPSGQSFTVVAAGTRFPSATSAP